VCVTTNEGSLQLMKIKRRPPVTHLVMGHRRYKHDVAKTLNDRAALNGVLGKKTRPHRRVQVQTGISDGVRTTRNCSIDLHQHHAQTRPLPWLFCWTTFLIHRLLTAQCSFSQGSDGGPRFCLPKVAHLALSPWLASVLGVQCVGAAGRGKWRHQNRTNLFQSSRKGPLLGDLDQAEITPETVIRLKTEGCVCVCLSPVAATTRSHSAAQKYQKCTFKDVSTCMLFIYLTRKFEKWFGTKKKLDHGLAFATSTAYCDPDL